MLDAGALDEIPVYVGPLLLGDERRANSHRARSDAYADPPMPVI
jgi:riboflavin biosynthesis pyrimidine reductase